MQVRLEGCTFNGTTPDTLPVLLADNRDDEVMRGMFYSDTPTPQVCVYEGPDDASVPPVCDIISPSGLRDQGAMFINATSPWLQQVKQVRISGMVCPESSKWLRSKHGKYPHIPAAFILYERCFGYNR